MSREQFTFCAEIKWETENAYLLTDGVNEFWVPKSQVTDKEHISGSDYEFTIPEWLAIDKEII